MLSYMIPVEEHSPNRNLSLNLNSIANTNNGNNHSNMSNTTTTTTIITINNLHQDNDLCDEDLIDENTKLLSYERQANGDAMKPHLNQQRQQQQKNQKNKIAMKNVTNNCDEIQKNGHVTTSAIKSDNNVETLGNKLKSLKKNMEEQKQNQEQSQKDQNQQQNQQKKVTLKRVSFGSSKGSMVETVVYETPTPVSEYPERFIGYHAHHPAVPVHQNGNHHHHQQQQQNDTPPNASASTSLNDSGIAEMQQEEIERSKVRVSFFENSKPQVISSPEFNSLILYGDTVFGDTFANSQEVYVNGDLVQLSGAGDLLGSDENSNNKMAAVIEIPPNYDRQQSTDSGWDNPFRPDGDLSKEADEIVNLIKGGKPITPTTENHLNGNALKDSVITENGTTVVDGAVKSEAKHLQSQKSPQKGGSAATKNGDTQQISNQVIPGPQSATNVVIDDKKKKKRCCVIQ